MQAARPAPLVVIVAYRADAHLAGCLATLATASDVLVVDNDAAATTEDIAATWGAAYLPMPHNVGFAAAVNAALDQRAGRDVLLLNPDARVEAAQLAFLQSELHARDRVAAVGPSLVDAAGRPQLAAWPVPSPSQVWLDAVGLSRLWRGRTFVVGAALLLNADALDALGGFDERYFLYAEEADWQLNALRHGWTVAVVGAVTVVHEGGASSSDPRVREQHFHASGRAFARKWYGRTGGLIVHLGTIAAALRRSVVGDRAARESSRRLVRRTWRASTCDKRLG